MKGPEQNIRSTLRTPASIGGAIGKVMRSLGLQRPYHGWQVVEGWADIVGPDIANHTKAIRYENGTLYVAVPDDSWRQQLSMQSETILRKIHDLPHGRAVADIRLLRGEKRKQ